jgi:hypothetical protein
MHPRTAAQMCWVASRYARQINVISLPARHWVICRVKWTLITTELEVVYYQRS